MKASLIATALILLIGGLLVSRNHVELRSARAEHEALAREARGLGAEAAARGGSAAGPRASRQPRAASRNAPRELAAGLLALLKEIEEHQLNGLGNPDNLQARILDLVEAMMELNTDELRSLLTELTHASDVNAEMRQGLNRFAIMAMSERHPQAALEWLFDHPGAITGERDQNNLVMSSITQWAKNDPLAAMEWLRKHQELHPGLTGDSAKIGLLAGVAGNDPQVAFSLIDGLGFQDTAAADEGINRIMASARGADATVAAITALRHHLATTGDSDALHRHLAGMAHQRNERFAQAQEWLNRADLDADAKTAYAKALSYHKTKSESPAWIDWMKETVPAAEVGPNVARIVGPWTHHDHRAVDAWLAEAPNDAAKSAAIGSYATTIASHDPDAAARWVMTIPPGPERDDLLRDIQSRWRPDDQDGQRAFAERFGLE